MPSLALRRCVPAFFAVLCGVARAQELDSRHPPAVQPGAPTAQAIGISRERVDYSEPDDGSLWARGANYKASFSAEGASFIPFLGSDAPQNYPLSMNLASVSSGGKALAFEGSVAPARAGDTVDFDRGSLIERYQISMDSIEQMFVFAELPTRGELVVRIATQTELSQRDADDALEFENERGRVRYTRAVAVDADGRSAAAPTSFAEGGIEIRVPAEFLATARMPLVIDPVVSSFTIANTTLDDYNSDVSFDLDTSRFLVVYEQTFSATDHDVYLTIRNYSDQTEVFGGYVDSSAANWTSPRCANVRSNHLWLVVATVGNPGSRIIRGARINASPATVLFPFTISPDDQSGDKFNADVGGDPYSGSPSYFAVVWERDAGSQSDIHARLVRSDGVLPSPTTTLIENSAASDDTEPSISKSNATDTWNIVWERVLSATNHDIYGARISWDGIVTAPTFAIDTSALDSRDPQATGPSTSTAAWAVTYRTDVGSHVDLMVRAMSTTATVDVVNLSELEHDFGSGTELLDQVWPAIDTDGDGYVVVYTEDPNPGNRDVYVATLTMVGSQLMLSEGHLPFATSPSFEIRTQLAARHGATSRRMMAVWDDDSGGGAPLHNIEGGLYDRGQFTSFCHPGADGVGACPCGNPPGALGRGCNNSAGTGGARLSGSGVASLAADSMLLTSSFELPTALSIFNQGNALLPSAVTFGQGLRCTGGSLKRLYTRTASGGVASAPTGADPDISVRSAALGDPIPAGSARYYYVYYRDSTVLGGCPAGSTFNKTQALQAIWAP